MSILEAPDPHSVCSVKPAPSLTDNLSESSPAEFLPQSVSIHSSELTSLSKSANTHPNSTNFRKTIMVMPEKKYEISDYSFDENIIGVCTDYPLEARDNFF